MVRTIASRSVGRGLAKVEVTTTDTLVAFAAKAGMTAADGDRDHSPFTTASLDNLTVPGLDLRLALGRVRDEVMKETANKQEPYVYGSLGGSTVALVPKPKAPPPTAKPVISSSNALARDYAFAEGKSTQGVVVVRGGATFWPSAVLRLDRATGEPLMGELAQEEEYVPGPQVFAALPPDVRGPAEAAVHAAGGKARRRLVRTGNYELNGTHFNWVSDFEVRGESHPD